MHMYLINTDQVVRTPPRIYVQWSTLVRRGPIWKCRSYHLAPQHILMIHTVYPILSIAHPFLPTLEFFSSIELASKLTAALLSGHLS